MSLKDFKDAQVKYLYDQDQKIYSVKVNFKGKPMILTMRVGQDIMDITLTDMQGKEIEYLGQNKKQLAYRFNETMAAKFQGK